MMRRRNGQSGASLIELMFTVALASITMVAITRFISRSRGSLARFESNAHLVESGQRTLQNIHSTLGSATELITDYEGGSPDTSSLQAIVRASIAASTGSPSPVSFSALPLATNQNKITLNGGPVSTEWGNQLFMAVALPPVTFTVYVSGTAVVSPPFTFPQSVQGFQMRLGRLQYVAIYLAQDNSSVIKGGIRPLRLVEWRSKPYVVYDPFKDLAQGPHLTATCQALITAGYSVAVDSSKILDTALSGGYYSLANTGVITNVVAPATLGRSSWAYMNEYHGAQSFAVRPTVDKGRVAQMRMGKSFVSGNAAYSVAYNMVSPTVNPTLKINSLTGVNSIGMPLIVPAYALPDMNGLAGFPGGLEIGLVGKAGAREAYVRLVQMASSGAGLSVREVGKVFQGVESVGYTTINCNN